MLVAVCHWVPGHFCAVMALGCCGTWAYAVSWSSILGCPSCLCLCWYFVYFFRFFFLL